MFQYKTGSGVAQYKLTYPVVVWKFMLFHRLALKEDDAFNRLLSPSNHHFITILDFCSTILKQRCIPVEHCSKSKGAGLLYGRLHPIWRLSLTCLRCAQRLCVCEALPSFPLMSLATVTPRFILQFLKLCFRLKVFPYTICPRDDAMSKISQMLVFRIFNSSK